MNPATDRIVWRVFEESAIVRVIERMALRFKAAANESTMIGRVRAMRDVVTGAPGHVIVAAALTYLVLMALIVRPASWQWLMLPSIALIAGIVLIAGYRHTDR